MRIITLEEHVSFPHLAGQVKQQAGAAADNFSGAVAALKDKLADVHGERLQLMDEAGITMQVLSVVGPGANLLQGNAAVKLAADYNDTLAMEVNKNPGRFAAFAHLPTTRPEAAATELERAVKQHGFCGALINGMTGGKFLDAAEYAPLLARAQQLAVPIYLHPGMPPDAVKQAYYSGVPNQAGDRLAVAGWGWHAETALHVLRLIVSGTFDKYPNLKLIIGHMGEMLPMMMARCDTMFNPGETGVNQRTISQTLKDQVYITTSGIFTQPPFQAALATFGIDRILYSVDYPFATNQQGQAFLSGLDLSTGDREKLCWRNAAELLRLS